MSKLYKNPGTFAGSWEIQVQKPLDDRAVVDTQSALTAADTWKSTDGNYYHYNGMIVSCADTGAIYTYIGRSGNIEDVKDSSKWKGGVQATPPSNDVNYAQTIKLEDHNTAEKTFDTVEAVFTYNGKTVVSKYYVANTTSYIVFKSEAYQTYLLYTITSQDNSTIYTYSTTYTSTNVPSDIKKLFEVNNVAFIKQLTGATREYFTKGAEQLFVDNDGIILESAFVKYDNTDYALFKTKEGNYWEYKYTDATRNTYKQNETYEQTTVPDWIKNSFVTGVSNISLSNSPANPLTYNLLVDGVNKGIINIPEDQFLSNVQYNSSTKTLKFTYNVQGENSITDVDLSSLIDTYSGGTGIDVINNVISINGTVVTTSDIQSITESLENKQDKLTAGDGIRISEDNVISVVAEREVTISGATPAINLSDYLVSTYITCSNPLTSLAINGENGNEISLRFTVASSVEGGLPITLPEGCKLMDDPANFIAEADGEYELSIRHNIAVLAEVCEPQYTEAYYNGDIDL